MFRAWIYVKLPVNFSGTMTLSKLKPLLTFQLNEC